SGIVCTDAEISVFNISSVVLGPSNTNGIFISNTVINNVYLTNAVLQGNSATQGTGILVGLLSSVTNLIVDNVTISGNSASLRGGAITVIGYLQTLSLSNSVLSNNQGVTGATITYSTTCSSCSVSLVNTQVLSHTGSQGALYFEGSIGNINVANSYVSNNNVGGGVIYLSGSFGIVTLSNTTFTGNSGVVTVSKIASGTGINVYNCTFSNNQASNGGVLSVQGSMTQLVVYSSAFLGNTATGAGGSIWVFGTATPTVSVYDSIFNGNKATDGAAVYVSTQTTIQIFRTTVTYNTASSTGGGISSRSPSSVYLEDVDMFHNAASKGAGVYINTPSLNVTGSRFNYNSATAEGGALHLDITPTASSRRAVTNANIDRSSFAGNQAPKGGVMMMYQNADVSSSTFTNNTAQQGALFGVSGSTLLLSNSNATDNSATSGAMAYVFTSGQISGTNNNVAQNDVSTATNGNVVLNGQFTQSNLTCPNGTYYIASASGGGSCSSDPPTSSSPTPTGDAINAPNTNQPSSSNSAAIIGGVVGGVVFLLLVGVVVATLIIVKRSKRHGPDSFPMDLRVSLDDKAVILKWDEMKNFVKVGQGAFGVVYSVQWRGINAAVKQVINQSTLTQQSLDEFLGEIKLMQNLRPHPNVVLFLGITVTPDPLGMVTEFCHGGSLLSYLNKNADLDHDTKFKFIKGIALGMVHLSAEKIVHRDLAARNVLLTEHLEPKISDFGLSRLTETEDNAGQTQSMVGPIKWMAPEAINMRKYSTKSDAFAFGVTVWEICTQKEPWEGVTPVNAAVDVLAGARLAIPDEVPAQFTDLMINCWEQEPENRPDFLEICEFLKVRSAEPKPEPVMQFEYGQPSDSDATTMYVPFNGSQRNNATRGSSAPQSRSTENNTAKTESSTYNRCTQQQQTSEGHFCTYFK
ncbi:Protein kinase domain containing protein, partial [Planoprotostelium fungivorum]